MMGINGLAGNGNGPWRIEPDCPGLTHNSLRSSLGHAGPAGRVKPKCICPHGQDLLMVERGIRRIAEAARMRTVHKRSSDPRTRLQPPMPEPVEVRSPNFAGALCTTPRGRKAADAGMNEQPTLNGIASRDLAKAWCASCPLLLECRNWVTTQEQPAGSWGGVWGGLDPWNRKGLELVIRGKRAEVIPYVG
jgi:hypothetical protein